MDLWFGCDPVVRVHEFLLMGLNGVDCLEINLMIMLGISSNGMESCNTPASISLDVRNKVIEPIGDKNGNQVNST